MDSLQIPSPNKNLNNMRNTNYYRNGKGLEPNKKEKILYDRITIKNFIKSLKNSDNINKDSNKFSNMYQSIIPLEENTITDRNTEYDLRFASSIYYLIYGKTFSKKFSYYIMKNGERKKKTINFSNILYNQKNQYLYAGKKRLQFFREDIYEMSPSEIIEEYEEFVKEGFSTKFFKANVVNIAILIECYDRGCFNESFIKIGKIKKSDIEKIFNDISVSFTKYKSNLIKLLINAYLTCSYKDICELYKGFLICYRDTYGKYIQHHFSVLKNTGLQRKNIIEKSTIEITNIFFDKIIQTIEDSLRNNFFIYLSCNHVSENKQAKLYVAGRIMDSYIGNFDVHDSLICNLIDIIMHDFYFHGNLERVKNMDERILNINRDFIKRLYEYSINLNNIDIYNFGMFIIQIIQNEIFGIRKGMILVLDQNFFSYLVNSIEEYRRFIKKYSNIQVNNINLFKEFLSFVHQMSSLKNKKYHFEKNKNYNSHLLEIKINNNDIYQPEIQNIEINNIYDSEIPIINKKKNNNNDIYKPEISIIKKKNNNNDIYFINNINK